MIDLTGKNLVVVDMTPGERKSIKPGVLDAVGALVSHAVQADSFVCFLEFLGPPTFAQLLNLVRRYDQFVQELKQQMDGSDKVLAACDRGLYDKDAFVVCGVDAFECVAETALSLARKLPHATIEVVVDACSSRLSKGWNAFPSAPNIKLVHLDGSPAN